MPRSEHRLADTDVVSFIMGGKPEGARFVPLLEQHIGAVSFVTVAELLRGAYQANWGARRISQMEEYLRSHYVVLPYTIEVARHWAKLVAECAKNGAAVGQNDAWIAATAVAFDCTVIARDSAFGLMAKHYPQLRVLP